MLSSKSHNSNNCQAQLQAMLEHSDTGLLVLDAGERVVFANPAAAELLGTTVDALLGSKPPAPCRPALVKAFEHPGADKRILEIDSTALDWNGQPALLVSMHDITRLKPGASSKTADRDASIFQLCDQALRPAPLAELRKSAAAQLRDILGIEFSAVLAYEPDGNQARLVSGAGWQGPQVDRHTVPVNSDTPAGQVILHGGQVIVTNWRQDKRFIIDSFLQEHDIVSSITVAIPNPGDNNDHAWGALGAYSTGLHAFSTQDINYMRRMAYILAYALRLTRQLARQRQDNMLLRMAGRTARIGGWEIDPEKDRVTWSDQVCAQHGLPAKTTILTMTEAGQYTAPESFERCQEVIERLFAHGESFDEEFKTLTVDGRIAWVRAIGEPVHDAQGRVVRARGAIQDITKQKRAEDEIQFLALYDPLTQLPNRRLFSDRLRQASAASRRSGRKAVLMLLDLDDFKTLNDTLGHAMGDQLLQQVAARLTHNLREGDTVARLGGDEFVMIVTDLDADGDTAATQAVRIGEQLLAELRRPYRLQQSEYFSTLSLGITMFGFANDEREELLKQADLSMYEAKARGRDQVCLFDPDMQAAVRARATLEGEMRRALKQGGFQAHYQPQTDADGHTQGAELLARWQHPLRGSISPAEFIPVAEDSGLILQLGHFMLETACATLARWAKQPATAVLQLSVNVSARQFHHPDFVNEVRQIITHSGADPQRLVFELTETSVLSNMGDTINKMQALKDVGITFSLDDFGTGYSSLYYLKHLPLTYLKIDRGFVHDVDKDGSDATIVRTILALAHAMELQVIAEGVETTGERDFLRAAGCPTYQGFLFAKPMPLPQLETFLEQSASTSQQSNPGQE